MLKTQNGGTSWIDQSATIANIKKYTIYSVYAFHEDTVFIGGSVDDGLCGSPLLLRTTDGGVSWSNVEGKIPVSYTITFFTSTYGFAGGSNYQGQESPIFQSKNNGAEWIKTLLPSSGFICSIVFTQDGTAWAAGFGGKIFKCKYSIPTSVASGGTEAEKSISATMQVHGNALYVSFDPLKPKPVSIRLYSINGKHIASWNSGHHCQGFHSVALATAGLSAGVYCVGIKTGSGEISESVLITR